MRSSFFNWRLMHAWKVIAASVLFVYNQASFLFALPARGIVLTEGVCVCALHVYE